MCAALPKTKRKATATTKSKSKSKSKSKGKSSKIKTKKKRKESARESRSTSGSSAKKRKASSCASDSGQANVHTGRWANYSKAERRQAELRAGYVPCALADCLRTFTSENGMLHHLRDKHNICDPRLGQKQKKATQCTEVTDTDVTVSSANILLDSVRRSPKSSKSKSRMEQTPNSTAPPAPAPQIASVSNDSVGARLLRLSGWTGGGLGREGNGIAGALLLRVMRCCCSRLAS